VKGRKYFAPLLLLILIVALEYIILSQTTSFGSIARQQNTSTKQNYVPNNSFEEGLDDFAVGWTYKNDTSTKIYRVGSVFCEGNYSYYIWSNTSAINAYSEYFSIIPGGYYNVSFSAKTLFPIPETASGYYLELLAKNETAENTIQSSTFITVTTDWTRYEYNWQIPGDYNYTKSRLRIIMILVNNTSTGYGASAWTDNVIVKPQFRSVICSQPFLLDSENLPSTLNFSAQFINFTTKPSVDANDFIVKLDEQNLTVRSVAYNETTQLYDITANLPSLQKGKYVLKLLYGSHESLNFKGVNVYQYTGNFSFIHWTDIHYDPPNSGYENQLNATLQLLKNANPEFILMTGDMASSEPNYQRFYAIMKSIDFDIPIFFSNGNHEKESLEELNNAVLYMGGKNVQLENEYPFTFNYGNYHFINLDSGIFPYASRGNISDIQLNWLKIDLQGSQGKHLVVSCHHPLYFTERIMFWSSITVASNIMRLFSNYGVVATFAGHAHRSDVTKRGETTYYTTVSGHNDTHWVGNKPFPPSGFRTIEIANSEIVNAQVTNLFSYYTGEFVYGNGKIR
jgi:predicted MPP superfamily phosphohydrolase